MTIWSYGNDQMKSERVVYVLQTTCTNGEVSKYFSSFSFDLL